MITRDPRNDNVRIIRQVPSGPYEKILTPEDLKDLDHYLENDYARESSYRRGWEHGLIEAQIIVFQLIEEGVSLIKIRWLMALYEGEILAHWRQEYHEGTRTPPPAFKLYELEQIGKAKRGYDYLLEGQVMNPAINDGGLLGRQDEPYSKFG